LQNNDWAELASQWQSAGRQWASWWTHAAGDTSGAGAAAPAFTNAATASPTLPVAWIEPSAAASVNERYARQFELLWTRLMQGPGATPDTAPAPDRRFAATAWREHPYFALLKETYLLYADYVREITSLAQTDADSKRRLEFVAKQYVDAIAPSNFLATNPEAIQLAFETGGVSLSQGMSNLLADAKRGHIAMTDESAFEVGRNLAITPGSVVFRNELIELIQYAPTKKRVFKRPLLIVPPCINKYYVLDLQPDNSLVRFAVDQGHTVFIISWRNITAELAGTTWDDYIEKGVLSAVAAAQQIASSKTINALGFCVGGTLLASTLAVSAARRDVHVASVTLLATMLDFADPGDIGVYISREALAAREPMLLAGGRVAGSELASAFASLRPNELVWNYVVGNYLKGQTPPPFDLLYWNGDSANLPGPMYVSYLRNMYIENRLSEPDALTMCGEAVDLGSISMPAYVLATREDHIVPWRSAYKTITLLGGDVTFVLGGSGHIAGIVNPPQKKRRNYWTNELIIDDADDWLSRAESHPGSWWVHWAEWLAEHGGTTQPAPAKLGSAMHPALDEAPGTYVTERVA
jgi:polyhydroxyalkanoate synthase subunit PhaC